MINTVLLLCFCFNFYFQDIKKYKLGNPRKFHYLNQSNCYELDGVDDSKEYQATRRAMDVVGISYDEQVLFEQLSRFGSTSLSEDNNLPFNLMFQESIFRVVAAILHLGNIKFSKGKEMDSSAPKDENSWFHLRTAAELFMYMLIYIGSFLFMIFEECC